MNLNKPLLLIDIDGVISLFGFDPRRAPGGHFVTVDGIIHFLSAAAGEQIRLLSGAFTPVWCSGWEEKANEYLPRELGLTGPLPYLTLPPPAGPPRAHWKLEAIERYAGPERPLAWLDDAFDASCEQWATRRGGPTLLVRTDPAVGLTIEHGDELLRWAGALEAGQS